MKSLVSILVASLFVSSAVQAAETLEIGSADLSQLEMVSKLDDFKPSENEFRIYYIGDSITRHGFNAYTIEKLKWDHVAGMAASSEAKDYAHLLADRIRPLVSGKKVRLFLGAGGDAVTALTGMESARKYQPSLVVVQLGEHVKGQDDREKIASDYGALLDALKALPSAPLVITTGVWSPQRGQGKYTGRTALIEEVQAEVSRQKNVPFASVEKYAVNPACSGTGSSEGVKWHPNDAGQAGYAEEIMKCFKDSYKP